MGILGRVLGIGRWKVYRLRKKWDRLREAAERSGDEKKRGQVLQILDRIESILVQLEEQQLSWGDRARYISQVVGALEEANMVLKRKEEKPAAPSYAAQGRGAAETAPKAI